MNNQSPLNSYTTFDGFHRIESGSLLRNGLAVKRALGRGAKGPVLTFDNRTGLTIEFDTRGSEKELAARLSRDEKAQKERIEEPDESVASTSAADEPRARGRPRLGVIAREVTLLPRHWAWLATQPGGASVALRKLVEEARKSRAEFDRARIAQERAYHFMLAVAGNLPGYEEATRALFANDQRKFRSVVKGWPTDVRDHAIFLAYGTTRAEPIGEIAAKTRR